MTDQTPAYLLLGEVLRPHGVRGELRMRVLTDYPERIPQIERVYLGQNAYDHHAVPFQVEHMRPHKGYGLLKLKTINNRNDAEVLRGLFVMVQRDAAVPLEDDEIYLYQLIGMQVITTEDLLLGELTEVIETGANDVYVVQSRRYGEVLIPVTPDTIVNTDPDSNRIRVRLPEGLLPD